MILDTTFIIDLMQNDSDAVDRAKLLSQSETGLFITSISLFELHSGISRSKRPNKEKEKVMQVLEEIAILPLTDQSASEAGIIHGTLFLEGKPIGSHDCLIASIALEKGEAVLTRNVKDFGKIKNLKVETY